MPGPRRCVVVLVRLGRRRAATAAAAAAVTLAGGVVSAGAAAPADRAAMVDKAVGSVGALPLRVRG